MYACLECGRKFKTTKAAERAADQGCPKCGGCDIDLDSRLAAIERRAVLTPVVRPIDTNTLAAAMSLQSR